MKYLIKTACAFSFAALLFASCTMGDKGSEKVPDSVSIDTTQQSSMSGAATGNSASTGMDSTSADSTSKDTTSSTPKK